MDKGTTVGVRNAKPLPGGNTDNVYNTGDSRLSFAESLQKQHPDCVSVVWKFNRWHHQVDYSAFKRNRPKLRSGAVPVKSANNYGMTLVRAKGESSQDVTVDAIETSSDNASALTVSDGVNS